MIYNKCSKNGAHQNENMNRICLNQNCKQDAICCSVCSYELHEGHNQKSLKYVINKISEKVSEESNYTFNFEEFENLLNSNKEEILNEFRETINKFVQFSQGIEKKYSQFFDKIKELAQKKYSFQSTDQIKETINLIKMSQYDLSQLNQKMQQLLQFDPSIQNEELALLDQKSLNNEMLQIQEQLKQDIKKNSDSITEILQYQSQNLDKLFKWKLEEEKLFYPCALKYKFVKSSNSTHLVTHEEGVEYQNNATCGLEQVIYSAESFESGEHGYSMELVSFEQSSSWCFLIGVYEEKKAENNSCTTSGHPWSCLFNNCRGYITPDNKNFGQILKNGDVLNVYMDIDNNKYTVSDANNKLTYTLKENQWTLKGKKLKFFVSFLSPELNVRIKFLETY